MTPNASGAAGADEESFSEDDDAPIGVEPVSLADISARPRPPPLKGTQTPRGRTHSPSPG